LEIFVFMPSPLADAPLSSRFFTPLLDLLATCENRRHCSELPDSDWLRLGVERCLQPQTSGRGFLQTLAALAAPCRPENSHFFESLKSQRRLDLCAEINARLCAHARTVLPDALAAFPALNNFDVHAGDGHFHAHAAHDPADSKGVRLAVGHLYSRNLRSGCLSHLTVNDQQARKKEHDMRGLKRTDIATLRQGAPKGRKVLYVWDRAGIDFKQWHKWKQGSGIYMLSRTKTNLKLLPCGDLPFDRADEINAGVQRDELVGTATSGLMVRRITFHDVVAERQFEFLTNVLESAVPPGVLAQLYRMRWEIEKSFDEVKNKLGEKKAWATSATAKSMQAQFICLSVNLLQLLEDELDKQGIRNVPEEQRRAARLKQAVEVAAKAKAVLPKTLQLMQQITQHSVKLIRWVAAQLWNSIPWPQACAVLIALYAKL
jgi:hypothetical protein